jgi:hypothetical protein
MALVEHLDRDPEGSPATVGWSEHTTYDLAGNPVHVERRDASGAVTWTHDREYDVQHRVMKEFHPGAPSRSGPGATTRRDSSPPRKMRRGAA